MEQEQSNELFGGSEADLKKLEEYIDSNPWKVILVLSTIVVTCLLILAFYGGALYSCNQSGGTLDPLAHCYSKEYIESLNNNPKFDENGKLIMPNFSLTPDVA